MEIKCQLDATQVFIAYLIACSTCFGHHYGEECLLRRHSSPYCCWSLWWISADGTFSPTRNFITMRSSTLRGTFCSLITLATPRQDWTGSNPSRREGGDCGFTLSRSHSYCAVRFVYTQISPGHIWTTLYFCIRHLVAEDEGNNPSRILGNYQPTDGYGVNIPEGLTHYQCKIFRE